MKPLRKKIIKIFFLALVLNWVWEVAHSRLYLSYRGGAITQWVLFRAAVVDAIIITVLILLAQKFAKHQSMTIILGGLVLAIGIELWALETGRWTYASAMPIIPLIKTGLTPTVQLAITGFIVRKII